MVPDIIRDSPFGQVVHWASKGRIFPYPEEQPGYVPPEHLLARHDDLNHDNSNSRRSDDGATLVGGEEGKGKKRAYHSAQEQNDLRLDARGEGEQKSDEKEKERRGRDEEENLGDEEREEREKKRIQEHPGTANPRRAHAEGLHEKYQYLVQFEEGDPANPLNWSTWKRSLVACQISLLTTVVYIGSAIYTPSEEGIAAEFGVSQTVTILGLTLFILGYGMGPMLWSPLQETPHLGRNPVYWCTLALFVLLQVPIIKPTNLTCLLIFRFITGFVGSPALATGGASVSDIYKPEHVPYAMAIWSVGAVCGPILGPVVAGFAVMNEGWRWSIYELIMMSGGGLLIFTFFLPETYGPTILYKRAARLRKVTGNKDIKTMEELHAQDEPGLLKTGLKQITLAFRLCAEPAVMFCNIYIGLIYAIFYLWFEAFPVVFAEFHKFNLGVSVLPFLGFFVTGAMTVAAYCYYQKVRIIPELLRTEFKMPPEKRLELAVWAAPCIPISLLIFGWTGNSPDTHWIGPTIGAALYFPGIFCSFQCLLQYLQSGYPKYAASVLAGNDLFRSSMAAGFPIFGQALFHTLGVGPACTLLAGLNIMFMPFLFYFWKRGDRLRKKSKFAQ